MTTLVLTNGLFFEREINKERTLEDLQKIVGGYIEIPFLSERFYAEEIDIIINEEGKLIEECKPSIAVVRKGTDEILDILYGNVVFASHNYEGETVGLTERQEEIVLEELETEATLSNNKGKSYEVKVLYI